ncbi:putative bifunctional diguanylate cyclase/phosphodiesterase [Propionivibrio dicarboxylicus]|uniref:PAS domain S-box-containing protein/diguanylate cyclase (GGDEF) domain-containing protein n=1 Tax=Propionivibrio dicarboxylicus TaxID=83767 RepID=A0A1G8CRX5_9RHOO|nr:EAL domain-containing protein [Propionivibrio dicarboxylicus]SDH48188.1 PAS domain S-box-containing protein/diguanylate cyclase (GGDEF) domain-containing protein [Propionivibrio dicarboxylicus]
MSISAMATPDLILAQCIALCQQARTQSGEDAHRKLESLERILGKLNDEYCCNNPTWKPLEASEQPIIRMDLTGYITDWNNAAEALFGYTRSEAIGQHFLFIYADESDTFNDGFHDYFLNEGSPYIEVHHRKKTGEVFRANLTLSRIFDDAGQAIGMAAHLTTLSDLLSDDDRQRLHATIIENSDEGILITDRNEMIVSVNSAFSRITGYTSFEAIGQTPDLLRSGGHSADFRAEVRAAMHGAGAWQGEIIGRRKNGELFPQSVSIGVVRNPQGEVTHAFSIFSDISVLRAAEHRMQQIVNYDSLTGLPNRTLFNQLADQMFASASRNERNVALMVIDINRFTSVNDSLGLEIGDELLRQIAQRFRQALRDEDIIARFGGDEFVIALNIQKREHCGLVAEKLLETLHPLFAIGPHALHIEACIGIATLPEDGQNVDELQRAADVAMKRVQQTSDSGYLFFGPAMNIRAKELWQLEGELRQAVNENALVLHYQPKASLRNGRIVGAEALIRWPHPVQGMIPPSRFVPLAEETGLIYSLGNWVIEAACRQIHDWMRKSIPLIPIAVNLSARQFDAQLPDRISEIVERHGIPPEMLRLEITESLLVRGAELVIPIMNDLVARGFSLSLDDFGTGYSSLAYLKKFPISTLKIDRSFVIGVPQDKNDCAIAQAIVTMGKQLDHEIVAEGIENKAQMDFLRSLGCDQLQGYLFSPPVPADRLAEMVCKDHRLSLE